MDIKDLKINLLYSDPDGNVCRMEELIKDEEHVFYDDLLKFNQALGGLELITQRHFIFYNSTDFYDLEMPATFLIYSLVSLNYFNNSFLNYDTYLGSNYLSKLQHTDESLLILQYGDSNNELKLSFTNEKSKKGSSSNNFYFNDLIINKDEWINSAKIALDEYFITVKKIYDDNIRDSKDRLYFVANEWLKL